MSHIEKLGLSIMVMSTAYISDVGVRGYIYVGMFIAGFFLFLSPRVYKNHQMVDVCPTCGTIRIIGEDKCRVCGTHR